MSCLMLKDVNDNSPTFASTLFNASISEDTLAGVSVASITAEDADSDALGTVSYSISSISPLGTNGSFYIDEATGVVSTGGTFDRENFAGPYLVTVS